MFSSKNYFVIVPKVETAEYLMYLFADNRNSWNRIEHFANTRILVVSHYSAPDIFINI